MGPYGMVHVKLFGVEKTPSKVFGINVSAIPSLTTSHDSTSEQLFHFLVFDFFLFRRLLRYNGPNETSGVVVSALLTSPMVSDVSPAGGWRRPVALNCRAAPELWGRR